MPTSPTAQQSPEARARAEASPASILGGSQGWGRSGSPRPRLGIKEGPAGWEEAHLGTMETQRASLCLGRWSLWLLLLALVVPSASAQALSYREAVLRAVDRLNEQSSEANLYRLLELDQPPKAVSRAGAQEGLGGGGCPPPASGLPVPPPAQAVPPARKALVPLRGTPSARKPSQSWVPCPRESFPP